MCNTSGLQNSEIHVTISEVVLTPTTCALLINEVIKYLVYQKSQIPYPYTWLESTVSRKRKMQDDEPKTTNRSVSRNYHIASTAFSIMEDIMSNMKAQFQICGKNIHEIVILFGTTPHTPKELFRIVIPEIDMKHVDANHANGNHKNRHKVLRNVFLSEEWMDAMRFSYPCTNMYVLINKKVPDVSNATNFFLPLRDYCVHKGVRQTTIYFKYEEVLNGMCCLDLQVYEDDAEMSEKKTIDETTESVPDRRNYWYQAKSIFKGFKDCIINKQSASDHF